MDAFLDDVLLRLVATSVQTAMLVALAWALTRALPRMPASTQCWLWWLVGVQALAGLFCAPVELPWLPAVATAAASDPTALQPAATAMPQTVPASAGIAWGQGLLALWLAGWMARELGPDVPLHFSAFHPDWKMTDLPPTPAGTLARARRIARDAGLRYVYTGNVHDEDGGTTYCPQCAHALIVRDWYDIRHYDLSPQGNCPRCGAAIAGRFAAFDGAFGRHRQAVHVER